jgi:hypothetical protein
MLKEYQDLINEQWNNATKAHDEVVHQYVDIKNNVCLSTFLETQKEAIQDYGSLLEEQEKKLSAELGNIVIEYTAKISAIRGILRMLGREEEKRAGIQRELSVQIGSDTNEKK